MLWLHELICLVLLGLIPEIHQQPPILTVQTIMGQTGGHGRTREHKAGTPQAQNTVPAAAPISARALLAEVEAQEKLGWWYEARRTLQTAATSTQDLSLLRRYAEVEDTYGAGAPGCYRLLAEALEKSGSEPDYFPTLDRGFQVSLRENDLEHARWFAARLERSGRKGYAASLEVTPARTDGVAPIPGGAKALMFVARGREQRGRGGFFAQYGRTLLDSLGSLVQDNSRNYVKSITDHFKRVKDLESRGVRQGSRVSIVLSTRDDKSRKTTEEVLRLLGWNMQVSKTAVRVEAGEGISSASRQLTATSLNIDELAMQEALQSGRPFTIEITDDSFPVRFGLDLWRSQFFAGKQPGGGFAEALALNPVLAKVYVGLAALDSESASVLLRDIGLKQLAGKYADLLYRYATGLAVIGKRVMFPGGEKAGSIWLQLAGSRNDSPGEFFRALLNKDGGRLLAFYFNLGQLDTRHQQFFTRSLARTRQYYEMFRDSAELELGPNRPLRTAPIVEFVRGVPLDAAGRVQFPGGPRVWMVASGDSGRAVGPEELPSRVAKAAAAEQEDQILMRLMSADYKASYGQQSELENLLAVASIESHRTEPLDERSALMLAQQFAHYYPAWPYFTILTGLKADEFQRFFALGSRLHDLDALFLNDLMGQCHALIALLCRFQQTGRLSERQSARLFGAICDRVARANGPAELTTASLEITREMLSQALKEAPVNPDEAFETLLLDVPISESLEGGEQKRRLEAARSRHENYRKVLELQKVTSLRTLFSIEDAIRNLNRNPADPGKQMRLIEEGSGGLLTVEIPKSIRVIGAMKESLLSCQTKDVADLIARLRRALAKKDLSPQEIQKLTGQLLAAINPQVKIALAGIVYAYYLKPDDLPVSADPLLLRKHQFVRLAEGAMHRAPFCAAEVSSDRSAGSYFLGGFGDFSAIAGHVAFTSARREDDKIEPYFISQIGSIRASRWEGLQDQDLRLAALKISCGREWMVQAAESQELLMGLSDSVSGLLSFARKAELLLALQSRDWESVWDAVTLGDLYHLGDEYLSRYGSDPWNSPVVAALRRFAAAADGSRLHILGADLQPILYCSHPHLLRLSPYEYYQRYLVLDKIAARTSEFKLYLAAYFDRAGMPASLLERMAEPLAREVFSLMQLADLRDWYSVLNAYSRLNDEMITRVNRERQ